MKYFLIAGEASGDMHGSNLIRAIKQLDSKAEIQCWGGDLMKQTDVVILKHINELAFMGFVEVIKNIKTIFENLILCKNQIKKFKPDVIVYIDYPGFNMRIAKWAKAMDFTNVYYISPQIWAWKQKRAFDIKKYIHKMLVILPFEKEFYKKFDMDVTYVGHPLLDELKRKEATHINYKDTAQQHTVAVLPGSRKQEIEKMFPIMLHVMMHFPNTQFLVAKAATVDPKWFDKYLNNNNKNIKIIANDTYAVLLSADAALVTSGTATLETALLNIPQVVCYKANSISYFIAKKLVKIKYISLVNLILNKLVVKELIQLDMNEKAISKELNLLLNDKDYRQLQLMQYAELKQMLSLNQNASSEAAQHIFQLISNVSNAKK